MPGYRGQLPETEKRANKKKIDKNRYILPLFNKNWNSNKLLQLSILLPLSYSLKKMGTGRIKKMAV